MCFETKNEAISYGDTIPQRVKIVENLLGPMRSYHFIILGIDQEVENDSGSDDEYEQAEGSDVEQDSGDEGSDMEEGVEQGSDGEEDSDGEGEEVSFINNYCC